MADDLFATTLVPASFAGIPFPVSKADTTGGHDAVEHTAYRRRGADIEPTGQQPYKGTLTIPLVNGLAGYDDLFPGTYLALLDAFAQNPIGQLSHPTRGTFRAFVPSWHESLTGETRSSVVLEVQWIEHNGEVSAQLTNAGAAPTDAPISAAVQAAATDAAMAAADPTASYAPVTPVYTTQLAYLDDQTRAYGEVLSAVGSMLAVVNANLALAVFASAAAHPAVAALERLRATTYLVRDRYLGAQGRPRLYTVPRTTPLWQIAVDVYGDAAYATLLASANAVSDPLFVRAGTVLTVLPVT